MPRALRIQDAGYMHHVISRGNDRQVLFKSPKDFQTYIGFLEEARSLYPLKIYNFCLMDNHVHLLVEPSEDGSMSKVMEHVSKAYAKYFNAKYDHVGHVFQGRFKSFLIQEERYFFACSRYIDLNPVKANLVVNPADYRWSGYQELAYGKRSLVDLNSHQIYEELGANNRERQIAYKAFVFNYQGEDLDLMNKRAGILGDKAFKGRIKK